MSSSLKATFQTSDPPLSLFLYPIPGIDTGDWAQPNPTHARMRYEVLNDSTLIRKTITWRCSSLKQFVLISTAIVGV